jgi:hypothetical protein
MCASSFIPLNPVSLSIARRNLPYLIRLGLPFVVLNIYARVARPWSLEYRVTRTSLTSFTEVFDADLEQVGVPHVARFSTHGIKNFLRHAHRELWYHYWHHSEMTTVRKSLWSFRRFNDSEY